MVLRLVAQTKIEKVFFQAVELLFPNLDTDDSRYVKIAAYARKHYFNKDHTRICVLCAIPGYSKCFRDFYAFCKCNNLDPGRKEVIISDMDIFFTEDFLYTPSRIED